MSRIALISNVSSSLLNFRKELILDLVQEGHTVFCFANDFDNGSRATLIKMGATPVDSTLNSKGLNPIADLISTVYLSKQLKQLHIDTVLSTFVKPVIFGTLASKLAGITKITGMLEGLGNAFTQMPQPHTLKRKLIKRIQILLYRISLPKLDHLFLLNQDDELDLVKKYNIKVKNITILGGIGLNLEEFTYSKPKIEPINFLFIGRLLREKGIFEFLEAARTVKQNYPQTLFTILGGVDEGNPFGLSIKTITDYVTDGTIIYPGHVSNVHDWIRVRSVFVLPSYREGMPRSTQEAMAIGRPIITTNVPGCRDTVIDGHNGFIVPPFSSQAIVDKMLLFIQNPNFIVNMGLNSHSHATDYYNSKIINKVIINYLF